jgi:hypothetical protein
MADKGIIACKLPNGLTIDHRDVTVTLNGSDHASAVSGYGLTPGVDVEWFQDWVTGPARDFPAVARGLIFLAPNERFAQDQASDQGAHIASGLEGIDPDNPAKSDPALAGVEPTDEQRRNMGKARSEAAGDKLK